MRRFLRAFLLSAAMILTSAAACPDFNLHPESNAAPPDKGQQGSNETKSTGRPTDPNGFGAVASQSATTSGGLGAHTSSFAPGQDPDKQPAQRLGVGNVARNDGHLLAVPGNEDQENTGTRPGDHAELIYELDDNPATDPEFHPGKPK